MTAGKSKCLENNFAGFNKNVSHFACYYIDTAG